MRRHVRPRRVPRGDDISVRHQQHGGRHMIWECERYKWTELRAMGTASNIPEAVERLRASKSEQDAEQAYWTIDNVVVVQGSLYEAALSAAACLVIALMHASPVGRPRILELLVQIGAGNPDPIEVGAGNQMLKQKCLRELCKGVAMYLHLLQYGTNEEQLLCIDLICLCADADRSLAEQASGIITM